MLMQVSRASEWCRGRVLKRHDEVARRTDELVSTLPDLELAHPLPPAPWFEPGGDHR